MVLLLIQTIANAQIVWPEDWESGWDNWYASNGVWEIGQPGSPGPENAYSNLNCAGTILTGLYPANTDSRLTSPEFVIPEAAENPRLRLYQWYRFYRNDDDYGLIQLMINGEWIEIFDTLVNQSPAWTHLEIDLRQYAGNSVRLGFYLVSDSVNQDVGWYIDSLSLATGPWGMLELGTEEDFEESVDDWYASPGVWEIGQPGSPGPSSAYSGLNCAGTILTSNYPNYCNSRLISPPINIPIDDYECQLKFWHWYKFFNNDNNDYGCVQIKIDDPDSAWVTASTRFNNRNLEWTQYTVWLGDYAGQQVRIGFLIVSDYSGLEAGWYIDLLVIESGQVGIADDNTKPYSYSISQNYPNPFNASTMIKYELPYESFVSLAIYDILGRKMNTLVNGNQSAGFHQLLWYAGDISSGVYFYKIQANGYTEMKKMILLK